MHIEKNNQQDEQDDLHNKAVNNSGGIDLQNMRHCTDPVADRVVKSLMNLCRSDRGTIKNSLFANLTNNESLGQWIKNEKLEGELMEALSDFEKQTSSITKWAGTQEQKGKIDMACKVFNRFKFEILMLLIIKSLPLSYTGSNGVKVLMATGRLQNDTEKRLHETASLIVNTMTNGGILEKTGSGISTIQKVRLAHAMVRYYILNSDKPWDEVQLGMPVNQEDMAGTLLGFSVAVLTGLEELGVKLDRTEKEAYVYFWSTIGNLLGVHSSLLPSEYEEALSLHTLIVQGQAGKSEEAEQLTDSLVNTITEMFQLTCLFQKEKKIYHRSMIAVFLKTEEQITGKPLGEFINVEEKGKRHKSVLVQWKNAIRKKQTIREVAIKDPIMKGFVKAFDKNFIKKIQNLPVPVPTKI